ncbi:fatty acid desaturase [soil metagenome]
MAEPAVAEPATSDFAWRAEAHALLGELLVRSPAIYWTDFVLSTAGAWLLAFVYFTQPAWSALQIVAFIFSGVLFYRSGTFIHEIVHMPSRQMVWFKRAWNLFLGVPFLMPWILYRNHVEHHNPRNFGTPDDGEYLPLASAPVGETIKYLVQAPMLPLFMVIRFGVLTPASWLSPRLREWVLTRGTAAVSNPHYSKRFPKRDENHLKIVEAMCFVYLAGIGVAIWEGVFSWHFATMAYLLLAYTLALNWVRNLAAHRYANPGTQMTFEGQFADSINITGQTWLTVFMFPVGLRFHALHHLFPALPYHNLGKAHRRLMQRLPADTPYREANRDSFFAAVGELWTAARRTPSAKSSMPVWLASSRKS